MRRWDRVAGAMMAMVLATGTSLAGPPVLATQDHEGHSEIGQVSFPTSCSPVAQAEFERGVALLHSFWFAPAREAFTAATQADASCAMPYWGIAMTWLGNPLAGAPPPPVGMRAGWAAVERALAIGAPTQRERDFAAAVAIMYRDPEVVDHRGRTLAYEAAMERIYTAYSEDREAAVFYALSLNMTVLLEDKTYANQLRAAVILTEVFQEQPQHPGVTHYLIHSFDYPPLARDGVSAAFRYAAIAPAVPHAQHMPSHIFTRMGYWQESVNSNLGSIEAARAAAPSAEALQNATLHATDYLMYAYLQMGQDARAGEIVERVAAIERPTDAYALAAIPARWAIERNRWQDAARLVVRPDVSWERIPWAEAVTHFARGLGAARSGDPASAGQAADRLLELRNALAATNQDYWGEQVDIQRQVVLAWAARAERRDAEALELMRGAAQREDATEKHITTPGPIAPARELLGEMLLELGRPADALAAFEASQRVEPNRFKGLYAAARAAQLAGDQEKARMYFTQLLDLGQNADLGRTELVEARTFLALR